METGQDNLRRVALLIASLDRATAERLLTQLPDESALAVRRAMARLSHRDQAEQAAVIREFLAFEGRERLSAEVHVPMRPLDRASERLIAECLCEELPQAIAVALAHLPARRASEVVAHLRDSLQAQVLERLVEADSAAAGGLLEVRDEFLQWLNEQIERSLHRAELAARLATILEATQAGTRERILHNVSNSDARLARELQHQLAALTSE
jgi:flagellar motor switch protein FliG